MRNSICETGAHRNRNPALCWDDSSGVTSGKALSCLLEQIAGAYWSSSSGRKDRGFFPLPDCPNFPSGPNSTLRTDESIWLHSLSKTQLLSRLNRSFITAEQSKLLFQNLNPIPVNRATRLENLSVPLTQTTQKRYTGTFRKKSPCFSYKSFNNCLGRSHYKVYIHS